ncbi:MAG: hypothetical protein ACRCXV_09345 [Bacteroidales bacterium]
MKKIYFNDKYDETVSVVNGWITSKIEVLKQPVRISVFYDTRFETMHGYRFNPKYKIGDIVAVGRSYEDEISVEKCDCSSFSSTINGVEVWFSWTDPAYKNKMFAKAEYMHWKVQITKIGVCRVQNLSDDDISRIGILQDCFDMSDSYGSYFVPNLESGCLDKRLLFEKMIRDKFGDKTWDDDLYIMIYDFELINK